MKIVQGKLFATPVWAVQLDDTASLNRDLIRSIEALRQKDPRGVSRTNVLGWQTLPELQNLPEFKVFIDTALDVARQIGGSMKIRDDVEYRIEAWANVSQTGAYNVIHNHPNCHLSGSYYVRTPVGCGDIFFRDPRSGAGICVPPVHE
ncbi:MAG: TIGR02466 family protein, partial [Gammaproteobacteria bacterium]